MPVHKSTKLTPPSAPQNSTESLFEIQSTKNKIIEIKKNLNAIVDQMHFQQSYISKASKSWNTLPIWLKIVSGIIIFGICLAIGIFAHINVLTAIASVCAVFYIVTSLALDNHHVVEKKSREHLKTTLAQLADMLGHTIEALQHICDQLSAEIKHLKTEITRLGQNINVLEKQVGQLGEKVTQLGMTSEQLSLTQEELAAVKLELTQKMIELTQLIDKFSQKMNELQEANDTFKNILSILSKQLKTNDNQQKKFVEQFSKLFDGTSKDFAKTLSMLHITQSELATVKDELNRCNQVYKTLLTQHEKILDKNIILQQQLEKLINKKTVHDNGKPKPSTLNLDKLIKPNRKTHSPRFLSHHVGGISSSALKDLNKCVAPK